MSATPDSRLGDPKDHLIADLQQQLAECKAERDGALAREAVLKALAEGTSERSRRSAEIGERFEERAATGDFEAIKAENSMTSHANTMPGRSASKRQSTRKMLRNPVNTWAPSFPVLWINDRECPPILAPCIDTERGQMPFKPNYRFERAERDRAKEAKKEEKLRKRHERSEEIPNAESSDASKEPGPHESLRTA